MPPLLRHLPLPREIPTPIAAGVGFAVSLPATAVRLAITLPTTAIGAGVRLLGRYQELAEIGTAILHLRGDRDDDDSDPLEDAPSYLLDTAAWGAADADAEIVSLLDRREPDEEPEPAGESLAGAAPVLVPVLVPDVIATDPSPGARALAAAIEDRSEPPATAPRREDLPVDGYDGLSAAALRGRVSGLGVGELTTLRDYEAAHAKRITVLAMLERAIAQAG